MFICLNNTILTLLFFFSKIMIAEEMEEKFIYIYIYMCVYIYIYIYIQKQSTDITGGKEWHSCYRQSLFFDFSIFT